MTLRSRGTYGDPLGTDWHSILPGSSEFESFWGGIRAGGDILGIPQVLFPLGGSRRNVPPILPPRTRLPPVVIGEIPGEILPGVPAGPVVDPSTGGSITVPEGWETVVIGGVERIKLPDEYGGATQDEIPAPISEAVLRIPVPRERVEQLDKGDDEMTDSWGHVFRQGAGTLLGLGGPDNIRGGAQTPAQTQDWLNEVAAPGGGAGMSVCVTPRYLTYDTKTGKMSIRRRRRRRALCTDKDLACLAQIVAIVGKGQGGNIAVSKALR